MIRRLAVKDFGQHTSFVLDLDEDVTCLAGRTNSGKSTLLRAFGFVALNAPSGPGVVRHGAVTSKAFLDVDGVKVYRVQGKAGNYYKVGGKVRKAMGKEVPADVAALLNVGPVNFQDQDDPRFWLGLSPGKLAAELNEVFNLGVIDRTLKGLATKARTAAAEEAVCRDRLAAARAEAKSLAWAEDFAADVAALEAAESRLLGFRSRIASVAFLVEKGSQALRARDRAADAILCVSAAVDAGEKLRKVSDRARTLEKLTDQLAQVDSVATEIPNLSHVEVWRAKADAAAERGRDLEGLIGQLTKAEDEVCRLSADLEKADAQLEGGKRCPLCGAKTSSSSQSPTSTCPTSRPGRGGKRRPSGTSTRRNDSPSSTSTGSDSTNPPW